MFYFNNTGHKNKGIDNSIYTEKALETLLRKNVENIEWNNKNRRTVLFLKQNIDEE